MTCWKWLAWSVVMVVKLVCSDVSRAISAYKPLPTKQRAILAVQCPAGTYRGLAYDQVSECVSCPPNHWREDVKGKSLSSCRKCPANTSTRNRSGSTSIQDCLRCPAGTMSTEGASCKCITPQACDANQLPFPADAEKRDSVPYIGRW